MKIIPKTLLITFCLAGFSIADAEIKNSGMGDGKRIIGNKIDCYHNGDYFATVPHTQNCPQFHPVFVPYSSATGQNKLQAKAGDGYWTHVPVGSVNIDIDHDPGSEFCIVYGSGY